MQETSEVTALKLHYLIDPLARENPISEVFSVFDKTHIVQFIFPLNRIGLI